MTRQRIFWWLQAAGLRAALGLLRALGPVGASNLGGAVARAIGPLLPVSRVADRNLRLALPELDAAARRVLVRGVWDNLGRTVAELPHVSGLAESGSGPGWVLEGREQVDALLRRRGGAIVVTAHTGNWEVIPRVAAQEGVRFGLVYRAAGNPVVDRLVNRLRRNAAGWELPMFAKGAAGARGMLAHLRGGGMLGMLVDQKMNDGIEARFFGHPAMTASAAAALSLRFGCPVMTAFVERLGPARFRVVCGPPLDIATTGDRAADVLALTQAINDRVEAWVRARPTQWLWLHRRWPKEPTA